MAGFLTKVFEPEPLPATVRPDDYAGASANEGAAIITEDGARPAADEPEPVGRPTDQRAGEPTDGSGEARMGEQGAEPAPSGAQEFETVRYEEDAHVAFDMSLGVETGGEYQWIDGSRGEWSNNQDIGFYIDTQVAQAFAAEVFEA